MEPVSLYVEQCVLGKGLFTMQPITAGQNILSFTGPLLTRAEMEARIEHPGDPLQIGPDLWLDLQAPGLFANHSCDPNAEVYDGTILRATRDIAAHEEIRYDYGKTMQNDNWSISCRCGSDNCRGAIKEGS